MMGIPEQVMELTMADILKVDEEQVDQQIRRQSQLQRCSSVMRSSVVIKPRQSSLAVSSPASPMGDSYRTSLLAVNPGLRRKHTIQEPAMFTFGEISEGQECEDTAIVEDVITETEEEEEKGDPPKRRRQTVLMDQSRFSVIGKQSTKKEEETEKDADVLRVLKEQREQLEEIRHQMRELPETRDIERLEQRLQEQKEEGDSQKRELSEQRERTLEQRKEELSKVDSEREQRVQQIRQSVEEEFRGKLEEVQRQQRELQGQRDEFEREVRERDGQMERLRRQLDGLASAKERAAETRDEDTLQQLDRQQGELEKELSRVESEQRDTQQALREVQERSEHAEKQSEQLEREKQTKYDFLLGQTLKKYNLKRANVMKSHVASLQLLRRRLAANSEDSFRDAARLRLKQHFFRVVRQHRFEVRQRGSQSECSLVFSLSAKNTGNEAVLGWAVSKSGRLFACVSANGLLFVQEGQQSRVVRSVKAQLGSGQRRTVRMQWNLSEECLCVCFGTKIGLWNALAEHFTVLDFGDEEISGLCWCQCEMSSDGAMQLMLCGERTGQTNLHLTSVLYDSQQSSVHSLWSVLDVFEDSCLRCTHLSWSVTGQFIALCGSTADHSAHQLLVLSKDTAVVRRMKVTDGSESPPRWLGLANSELLCVHFGSHMLFVLLDSANRNTLDVRPIHFGRRVVCFEWSAQRAVMLIVCEDGTITLLQLSQFRHIVSFSVKGFQSPRCSVGLNELEEFVVGCVKSGDSQVFSLNRNGRLKAYEIEEVLRVQHGPSKVVGISVSRSSERVFLFRDNGEVQSHRLY